MKKLLIALLALGALSFAPAAEARHYNNRSCGTKSCAPKPACPKKVCAPCPKKCAPKCHTTVRKEYFKTPCKKWILVDGECDNERCIKTTVCEEVSETEKCISGCNAYCPTAANPEDRGPQAGGAIYRDNMAVDSNVTIENVEMDLE